MDNNTDNIATELRQVAKGTGISVLGRIGFQVLRVTFNYVAARALGQGKLGLYAMGHNVVMFSERIAALGMYIGGLRYASIYIGEEKPAKVKGVILTVVSIGVGMGMVVLVVLLTATDTISNYLFHKENLAPVLRIMVLAVPLLTLLRITTHICIARRTVTPDIVSRIVLQSSLLALFSLLWWLGLGMGAIAWAYVLAAGLGLVVAFVFLFKLFPVLLDRGVQPVYQLKEILVFSFPLLLVNLSTFAITRFDIFLVGIWRPEGEVGIYHIVHMLAFFAAFGEAQVAAVFRPIIADLHSRGELDQLRSIYKLATRWVVTISLPVALLLISQRSELLGLFGKEFQAGQLALVVLVASRIVTCSVGNIGWMLVMTGYSWLSLVNNTVFIALEILLGYLLIPQYGIVGAAIATGTALVLVNMVRMVEGRMIMGVSPYSRSYLKPYAAGVIAVATVYCVPIAGLLGIMVSGLVFLTAYFGVLYWLGFDQSDMVVLKGIARRLGLRQARHDPEK